MNGFRDYGRALLANGYLIVPIKPGLKRPAIDAWQSSRLGADAVDNYPGHGAGVLCGQGAHPIVGVDIDTKHPEIAAAMVDWCETHLGATCKRVGNAPKVLLVYRAERSALAKETGTLFKDATGTRHRLEVLGNGQQFVAYHEHPDTRLPYEWTDLVGGIEAMHAQDLPTVTHAQLLQALAEFERLALQFGLVKATTAKPALPPSDPDSLDDFEPPAGISLPQAKRLLEFATDYSYEAWLQVGMALHHEFEGADDALEMWDEWSAKGDEYKGRDDLEYRWEGFGRRGGRPLTIRWLIKLANETERAIEKAELLEARTETRLQISRCADHVELLGAIARAAGEVSANNIALRAEFAGLLRERFQVLTGQSVPIADVRKAMQAAEQKRAKRITTRRQLTEFGNAERMLDQYGEGLMFVPELDAWYAWSGVYWRRVPAVHLENLAKQTVRALPTEGGELESDQEREAFYKFCAISQRAAMVANMVKLAQSDPLVAVPLDALDARSDLLGVGNGAVDLTTGKLLAPDVSHRVTRVTGCDFLPKAVAPLWEQTLLDVFCGDPEMVAFFQRLIGYTLLGTPHEDVLVIPHGWGANGKSTVLGAIRDVLGDYAKMAQAETFLQTGGGANPGGAREDILRLRGARFVYITEPSEGSELREDVVKATTGGESLPARALYGKQSVEVKPTWVSFMPTNHRPVVKGDDYGIWRRLMLVPFARNFDKDPTVVRDANRAERLAAEASGILAWCVRGALAYQKSGLIPPEAVRNAVEAYRSDMDLLAEWIEMCCDVGSEHADSTARLWQSWEEFAKNRGELNLIRSARSLGRRLSQRFSARKGSGGVREFAGIRVKPFEELSDLTV